MRALIMVLILFFLGSATAAENVAAVKCGSSYVGQMLGEGWSVVNSDYISKIADDRIELEDGTAFQADMTSGMLAGDEALVLAKHVRSSKRSGYIYTICAGGFDAWVTQVQ